VLNVRVLKSVLLTCDYEVGLLGAIEGKGRRKKKKGNDKKID
jgi:hypothetical protein